MKRILFLLALGIALIPHGTKAQNLVGVRVVTACGAVSPYTGVGNVPVAGSPWSLIVDPNGNLCTNAASGGGTSAVYPSGGASGSSNGIGNTDANAFDMTYSGAAISGWAAPSSCTQPSLYGSLYFAQCMLTLINSAIILPTASHISGASASLTSLVVKNAAGNLYGFNCTAISGAASGFCIAYNGSSAPSTGALTAANVLDYCYFNTTPQGCALSHASVNVAYSTGIVILISSATTPYTYTTGTDTGAITADYQ